MHGRPPGSVDATKSETSGLDHVEPLTGVLADGDARPLVREHCHEVAVVRR